MKNQVDKWKNSEKQREEGVENQVENVDNI